MPKSKSRKKKTPKRILALPDLEQTKAAVLDSLTSASAQRTYDHAIREFDRVRGFPGDHRRERRDGVAAQRAHRLAEEEAEPHSRPSRSIAPNSPVDCTSTWS